MQIKSDLKPNFLSHLDFLEFGFQTEKSVWNPNVFDRILDTIWNPNCLQTGQNWTVRISDIHCILNSILIIKFLKVHIEKLSLLYFIWLLTQSILFLVHWVSETGLVWSSDTSGQRVRFSDTFCLVWWENLVFRPKLLTSSSSKLCFLKSKYVQ